MEVMTYVLDDRVWTREERDGLPDDGSRHELIDEALVVTPTPRTGHQWVSARLHAALLSTCPAGWIALAAPFDVTLGTGTAVQPDLLVASVADLDDRGLTGPPHLAVEITSPSTRLIDRNLKFARLEAAGCPSFWILDPDVPSLTAWDLVDGSYVEVAHVEGDQSWRATQPFAVTITPSALLT